jgi:hypothetical protein
MVNLARFSALLTYSLKSISYKPIPIDRSVALHGPPLGQSGASQIHSQGLSKSLNQSTKNGTVTTLNSAQDPGCFVEPYNAPPILDQAFPPFDPSLASTYRYRQQQGVNLGSW